LRRFLGPRDVGHHAFDEALAELNGIRGATTLLNLDELHPTAQRLGHFDKCASLEGLAPESDHQRRRDIRVRRESREHATRLGGVVAYMIAAVLMD